MPSYKLTYFQDLKGGRGDSIRLAFHSGGIPFTDERVTLEQFAKIRETLPSGQLPILTVDEKTMIPQEGAILRYIGRSTGIYPDDREEALSQEIILGFVDGAPESLQLTVFSQSDVIYNSYPDGLTNVDASDMYLKAAVFFAPDNAGKEFLKKNSVEEGIPKAFAYLDKYLSDKGTTYSAGNDLSVADFKLHAAITLFKSGILDGVSTTILDNNPHISKVYQAIEAHEKVSSWKKTQPQ